MRLTGIIDYTMDNFLCVRGFASMLQLSEISKADEKIQRDLIDDHRGEMENFLSDGNQRPFSFNFTRKGACSQFIYSCVFRGLYAL